MVDVDTVGAAVAELAEVEEGEPLGPQQGGGTHQPQVRDR